MKKFLVLSCCLLSLAVFADEKESNKKENIEEIKQKVVSNLDQRISNLQTAKSCIQAASDHEGIKQCRKQLKEVMMKLKEENQKERRERREKRNKD